MQREGHVGQVVTGRMVAGTGRREGCRGGKKSGGGREWYWVERVAGGKEGCTGKGMHGKGGDNVGHTGHMVAGAEGQREARGREGCRGVKGRPAEMR